MYWLQMQVIYAKDHLVNVITSFYHHIKLLYEKVKMHWQEMVLDENWSHVSYAPTSVLVLECLFVNWRVLGSNLAGLTEGAECLRSSTGCIQYKPRPQVKGCIDYNQEPNLKWLWLGLVGFK